MRQSEVIKLLERFSAVVAGRYSPNAVIPYGSYAKGSPRASSDIDVAVMFDDFSGNWIEASTDLWDISYTIDSRIEPFLVDKSTANPSFVDEIEATGRVIWDSKSTRLP